MQPRGMWICKGKSRRGSRDGEKIPEENGVDENREGGYNGSDKVAAGKKLKDCIKKRKMESEIRKKDKENAKPRREKMV